VSTHDPSYPNQPGRQPPGRRGLGREVVAGRIEPADPYPVEEPTPPGLSSTPDLKSILRALRRRWIAAVCLGGGLAAVAAIAAWCLLSPKYTAEAKIRINYHQQPIFPSAGAEAGRADFTTYAKTQAAQILSRNVIWAALKNDDVKRLNLEAREKDPVAFIEDELKVDVKEHSEIVPITLSSSDPKVSITLVKAITNAYMDIIVYAETQARYNRFAELEKAYDQASNTLKDRKKSLDRLAKSLGPRDPLVATQRMAELQSSLREAKTQRNSIRLELVRAEADLLAHDEKLKLLKDPVATKASLEVALKVDGDYQVLRKRIDRYEEAIADYESKLPGQRPPTQVMLEERVARMRQQMARRRAEVQAELADMPARPIGVGGPSSREELQLARVQKVNSINALKELFDRLEREIAQMTGELTRIDRAGGEYEGLLDQIKSQERVVEDMCVQVEKERVELKAAPRITVFQEAELQKKDMKKQIAGTVVAPLAVLLGVCLALAWADCRQRRIRSAGEVARGLGIRVVGAVPALPGLERQLIGPTGEPDLEGHPVLESIDAIRTLLLRDAAARVVMVTSAAAGEGKTTLASHLASSLARAGRKTLLLDGDLRSPAAHQLFELPMQPGFSEVLLGEIEIADAVQPTTLDGLSFLAAGQWDREVLQALARDGLEAVFDKLQQEFDFIVIDSHPVLPATDSLLIGQQVDAVILSVLREVSQMPRVWAASQRLTSLGIRVLGAVVNGTDPEDALAAPARMAAA
jgi:succinoglycan biosynthesis transport protein ExoP